MPQPLPEPSPNLLVTTPDLARLGAFSFTVDLLRVAQHALGVLASHGISPSGPFPFVCVVCGQPWRCSDIVWATDWVLAAQRDGLLDEAGVYVSPDMVAILEHWSAQTASATTTLVAPALAA